MRGILKLIVSALAVMVCAYLFEGHGVYLSSFWSALWVALILAILNLTFKPIFVILTIPFTLVTFGLFLLVINALIIMMISGLVGGFAVDGFWTAFWFALVLTILQSVFESISGLKEEREEIRRKRVSSGIYSIKRAHLLFQSLFSVL
jgi:putative membrane protein